MDRISMRKSSRIHQHWQGWLLHTWGELTVTSSLSPIYRYAHHYSLYTMTNMDNYLWLNFFSKIISGAATKLFYTITESV
jgi:hypothetical protein